LLAVALVLGTVGCGKDEPAHGNGPGSGGHGPGAAAGGRPGGAGGGPGGGGAPAVPVEVAEVVRRSISSFVETNGTLEAENEVDLVARTSGPIVELLVEEGDLVQKDQLLARIDDEEIRSQVEISEVALNEARLSFERAEQLKQENLISPEEHEQAQSRFETAEAQLEGNRVLLGFTEIQAPFTGLIVVRYIDFAQQMSPNAPLFRLSDFTPLLCPIQIPERDLSKVRLEQRAYLTFEAWPDERFEASVLRISPVVDAATGTVTSLYPSRPCRSKASAIPSMWQPMVRPTDVRSTSASVRAISWRRCRVSKKASRSWSWVRTASATAPRSAC
jgi:membrane fusion protein (multidrug efflux system)